MSESPIYRHPGLYRLAIRVLYGRHHRSRQAVLAKLIPDGASVLELCCGPGALYLDHLVHRNVSYVGLDLNPRFVAGLSRRGVAAQVLDLRSARSLPAADCVVMQASLYHFLPEPERVLRLMLEAARSTVILSEPIRNLTTSGSRVLSWLGRRASATRGGDHSERLTRASLDAVVRDANAYIVACFEGPGGREVVYVLAAESGIGNTS